MKRKAPPDAAEFRRNRDECLRRASYVCRVSTVLADAATMHPAVVSDSDRETFIAASRRCQRTATTVHHKQPRALGGGGDNSIENLIATCPRCHDFVEMNPRLATLCGLKILHGPVR